MDFDQISFMFDSANRVLTKLIQKDLSQLTPVEESILIHYVGLTTTMAMLTEGFLNQGLHGGGQTEA